MEYNKTTWTEETLIDVQKLQKIEDGIESIDVRTLEKVMQESADNQNGYFIKWADGTLECWKNFGNVDITVLPGENIEIDYNFPVEFVGNLPATSHSGEPTSSTGGIRKGWVNGGAISLNTMRFRIFNEDSSDVLQVRRLSYRAIGKWK